MSDWSSFEKDKEIADAWRDFLNESEDELIELDEGFWGDLAAKGSAAASKVASKASELGAKGAKKARTSKLGQAFGKGRAQKPAGAPSGTPGAGAPTGKPTAGGLVKGAIGLGLSLILKDLWAGGLAVLKMGVDAGEAVTGFLGGRYWTEFAKTGFANLTSRDRQQMYKKVTQESEKAVAEEKAGEDAAIEAMVQAEAASRLKEYGALEGTPTMEDMLGKTDEWGDDIFEQKKPSPVTEAKRAEKRSSRYVKAEAKMNQKINAYLGAALKKMKQNVEQIAKERALGTEEVEELTKQIHLRLRHLRTAAVRRGRQRNLLLETRLLEKSIMGEKDSGIKFEDLVQLTNLAVSVVLKQVDRDDLVLALKGATQELQDLFLANVSSRAADDIREDMEIMGAVPRSRIRSAQSRMLKAALKLAEDGSIYLPMGQEEEEEEASEPETPEPEEEGPRLDPGPGLDEIYENLNEQKTLNHWKLLAGIK
jgi:hypothetical protein